jgi:hypothetical protein
MFIAQRAEVNQPKKETVVISHASPRGFCGCPEHARQSGRVSRIAHRVGKHRTDGVLTFLGKIIMQPTVKKAPGNRDELLFRRNSPVSLFQKPALTCSLHRVRPTHASESAFASLSCPFKADCASRPHEAISRVGYRTVKVIFELIEKNTRRLALSLCKANAQGD